MVDKERFETLLKRCDLTAYAFARMAQIDYQNFMKQSRGKSKPSYSLTTVNAINQKLADVLNVSAGSVYEYLFLDGEIPC